MPAGAAGNRSFYSPPPCFSALKVSVKTLFFFLFLLLIAFWAFSEEFPEDDGPVHFESDLLEYYEETGIIKGFGNVRVRRGDVSVDADYIEFDSLSGDMLAEGDVFFRSPAQEVKASRMEYNFLYSAAGAESVETFREPWFLEARSFSQDGPEKQVLAGASGTTCDLDRPHYRFTASSMEVEPGVAIRARNAVFYIGRLPVLYLPYYRRSLRDEPSGFVVRPGYSSERGAFALSYYSWRISSRLTGRWYLDYFRKIGWGKGFDMNVLHGEERPGQGYLYLYHIDEKSSPKEDKEPAERWKAHIRHSQRFSAYTRSILRADILSDPDFNRDYLTDESLRFLGRSELEGHRPEGSFSLATRKPGYFAEFFLRKRVNEFTTVVENLPRISFSLPERSIGETGFYYDLDSDFSYLNLSPAEEPESLFQARVRPGISHQSRLGVLRMNPALAAPGFWYEEDAAGKQNVFQGSYDFRMPVTLANGIWRIFDTPGWAGIEQTRHLISPEVTYFYRPDPGEKRDGLYSIADRVGDERESVRFEIRNVVEGRRADGSKFRFADLDVFSDYDRLAEERRWSNITADLRARSTRGVGGRARTSYNPYLDIFETFDADVMFSLAGWYFEQGVRMFRPEGERHTLDLVGRARGALGEKWRLDLQGRYDTHEDEFKALRVGVTRDLHCWEANVFWQKEADDTRIMLTFRIKGVPGASLESPY